MPMACCDSVKDIDWPAEYGLMEFGERSDSKLVDEVSRNWMVEMEQVFPLDYKRAPIETIGFTGGDY